MTKIKESLNTRAGGSNRNHWDLSSSGVYYVKKIRKWKFKLEISKANKN
jgi:hypothetical protein